MRQTYPSTVQYKTAINLIGQSIENERTDAAFYAWLINNIPNQLTAAQRQNIKETIEGIQNDEKLHNEIFKSMYQQLTGKPAVVPAEETFTPPANYNEGVLKAIKGETDAVRRYRTIMAGMPDNSYRDQVFNILTDELRHGILYNYIYTTVYSL